MHIRRVLGCNLYAVLAMQAMHQHREGLRASGLRLRVYRTYGAYSAYREGVWAL